MSHSRKHVTDRVLNEFPIPTDTQSVVRTFALRGNNVAEVEDSEGSKYLVMIPQKFNKCVWISRGTHSQGQIFYSPFFTGDFLIVEPFDNYKTTGNRALVVAVLYKEQIKHLKSENLWPERFKDEVYVFSFLVFQLFFVFVFFFFQRGLNKFFCLNC